MLKLLMTWDILPGKEDKYLEFLRHELAPTMLRLGMHPTDAWYALPGSQGPEVRTGGVTEDLETMEEILKSDEWKALQEKLFTLVTNFDSKIIQHTPGRFQI